MPDSDEYLCNPQCKHRWLKMLWYGPLEKYRLPHLGHRKVWSLRAANAKNIIQPKAAILAKVIVPKIRTSKNPTVLTTGTKPRNASRNRFLRLRYSFHALHSLASLIADQSISNGHCHNRQVRENIHIQPGCVRNIMDLSSLKLLFRTASSLRRDVALPRLYLAETQREITAQQ
jgi:hypothetical protein